MARCGCVSVCSCDVQGKSTVCGEVAGSAGANVVVTGSGAVGNPYYIKVNVPISTDPKNDLTCKADGLFSESSIDTIDTNTVDLNQGTDVGTSGNPLQAHVIRTPDANVPNPDGIPTSINLIKELPGPGGGIYVSCEDIQDCVGEAVAVIAGDCLTYNDATNSLNVLIAPDVADPGPSVGNGVECGPNGLLVAPSADAGNKLSFGADGRLYTAGASFVADTDGATDCVNISVVEGPAGIFTVDGSLQIDPASPTPAHCGPNGLSIDCVPSALTSEVVTDGSPCVSTIGDGCATPYHVKLGISPDPCNGLQCHGNGLFAFHDPTPLPVEVSDCANFNFPGPFNGTFTDTVVSGPFCVSLTNPSACSTLNALLRMSGVVNIQRTSGQFYLGFQISLTGPGGPWNTTAQAGIFNSGAAAGSRQTLIWPGSVVAIAPGGNMQVCARLVVSGVATVNGVIPNSDRCLGILPLSYTG